MALKTLTDDLSYLEFTHDGRNVAETEMQSTLKLEASGPSKQTASDGITRGGSFESTTSQRRRTNSKGQAAGDRSASRESRRGQAGKRSTSKELERTMEATPTKIPKETDELSSPSLDWTKKPNRLVSKEGNIICQVSTAAADGPRQHTPYLVRTTRIEPVSSPRSAGKPPIPTKKREQIVVTERDLKLYGGDLRKLREVCIQRPASSEVTQKLQEETPLDLSFKTAFDMKCREGGPDDRDPWKDVANPEEVRETSVQDLVLNQVWVKAMEPRKVTGEELELEAARNARGFGSPPEMRVRNFTAATRASSFDSSYMSSWAQESSEASAERRVPRRLSQKGLLPPRSTSLTVNPHQVKEHLKLALEHFSKATLLPAVGVVDPPGSRDRRKRRNHGYTDRSKSRGHDDRGPDGKVLSAKYVSPIRPLDIDETPRQTEGQTPLAQRSAAKFLASAQKRGETRSVWLSMEPTSGDIHPFPRAVGSRLEAAYLNGRGSVPLAGLGEDLDGTIVFFAVNDKEAHVMKTLDGKEFHVRREEVTAYSLEVTVNVVAPSDDVEEWRFAHRNDTNTERFKLELFGTELVAPPSPTLPPVSHNRVSYFINNGVDWAA